MRLNTVKRPNVLNAHLEYLLRKGTDSEKITRQVYDNTSFRKARCKCSSFRHAALVAWDRLLRSVRECVY